MMLAYRLPRTPSTPRITLWRKLRRLGVVQIVDGVVALPASADTREQLAQAMTERIDEEYREISHQAMAATVAAPVERRRILARLRRELRRVGAREYFPTAEARIARSAVEALAKAAAAA